MNEDIIVHLIFVNSFYCLADAALFNCLLGDCIPQKKLYLQYEGIFIFYNPLILFFYKKTQKKREKYLRI